MKKLLFSLLLVGSCGLLYGMHTSTDASKKATKAFFDAMEEGKYGDALKVVDRVNVHALYKEEDFEVTPLAFSVMEFARDSEEEAVVLDIVKKLIERKADVDWADKDGNSILMIAVNHYMPLKEGSEYGYQGYTDSPKMIHFLVERGADPYHQNKQGETLFDDLKDRSGDTKQKKEYNELIHWIEQNASSKKACLEKLDWIMKKCVIDEKMGKELGGIRARIAGTA